MLPSAPALNTQGCLLFLFLICCMNSLFCLGPWFCQHCLLVPSFTVVSSVPKPQHHICLEGNTEEVGFSLLTSNTVSFAVIISSTVSTFLPKLKDAFQLPRNSCTIDLALGARTEPGAGNFGMVGS